MFTQKDVAEYYNTTQNHYEKWWKLKDNLSLHYGIWYNDTKNFDEALGNTNKLLTELAGIKKSDKVLDAGCGVGGAAMFVHQNTGATVSAISLSEKQISFAKEISKKRGLSKGVDFHIMDYTQTEFEDASFDIVWACESVCNSPSKEAFIKEAFRLLKKGGKLILVDFFASKENQEDPNEWMKKWGDTWAVPKFAALETFTSTLSKTGFSVSNVWDYTDHIQKSAKRMYYSALLGALPSEMYNLFHPKVSRFAKTHYKCGYYQYKALQQKLWTYSIILAVK